MQSPSQPRAGSATPHSVYNTPSPQQQHHSTTTHQKAATMTRRQQSPEKAELDWCRAAFNGLAAHDRKEMMMATPSPAKAKKKTSPEKKRGNSNSPSQMRRRANTPTGGRGGNSSATFHLRRGSTTSSTSSSQLPHLQRTSSTASSVTMHRQVQRRIEEKRRQLQQEEQQQQQAAAARKHDAMMMNSVNNSNNSNAAASSFTQLISDLIGGGGGGGDATTTSQQQNQSFAETASASMLSHSGVMFSRSTVSEKNEGSDQHHRQHLQPLQHQQQQHLAATTTTTTPTPSKPLLMSAVKPLMSTTTVHHHHNDFFMDGADDDDDDDDDSYSSEEDSDDAAAGAPQSSPSGSGFAKKDPELRPGMAKRVVGPNLARFAMTIKETAKDRMLNAHVEGFRDWNLEELLLAAEVNEPGGSPLMGADAHGSMHTNYTVDNMINNDNSKNDNNNNNSPAGSPRRAARDASTLISPVTEALRHGLEDAFRPLKVSVPKVMKEGMEGVNASTHLFRTYDQRLMFLKKRLLMEEAAKRRTSVKSIRQITSTLRHDEKLLDGFTAEVRAQQMERWKAHRAAQEVLDAQRNLFTERTTQQRAAEFLQLEKHRSEKAEHSRLEQEETFLAELEDAMAMRRGASYSRQYAWLPCLVCVLTAMKFGKALKSMLATVAEQKVIEGAKKDFANVFVPTRVTGFLRLAQGYKDNAKKKSQEALGIEKRFTKAELQLHQEIQKKKQYYIELKKQELDHPQWAVDRLLSTLRALQVPLLLKRAFMRQRHQSADLLVKFLRTMFQQSVIRVRCKCFLKYHKACGRAFLQAVRNRRSRRNFMWALQFKHYVAERRAYDLGRCVEADHVLRRRERIRQKLAMDTKRALEAAEALRQRLLLAHAAPHLLTKNTNDDTTAHHHHLNINNSSFTDVKSPAAATSTRPGTGGTRNTSSGNAPPSPSSPASGGVTTGGDRVTFLSPAERSLQPLSSPPGSPISGGIGGGASSPAANNISSFTSPSALNLGGGSSSLSPSSLHQQHHSYSQPQSDVDITRILCQPMMIPHPYGKFGPQPREAALVARATMEYFRVSEIKWSPSDTAMKALLDFVQQTEDKAVYAEFCSWISTNRQHKERAEFLESVLSHLRDDAPQKAELEKQYQELLKKKPPPPRQPYVLPASEMRILVFAGYTLTAHEKRAASAKKAEGGEGAAVVVSSAEGGGGGGGGGKKDGGKPDPVLQEANVKTHIAKAMSLFKELHGNVRPFLISAVRDKMVEYES